MQQTKKRLFALALALWTLSSCSQDASDVQGSATGGETITFSLSAEVSVDDEQTRAIDYKLGNNAQGQLVPLPQFADKQEVDVHTVLKSSRGIVVAKTLKWKYDATKKKLVLSPTTSDITQDTNNIVVPNFNNDGGVKWYISGLIGGTLSGTKVSFKGVRELQGATSAGDAFGSLEVPYAFAWTELTINTQDKNNTRESGSYKYAGVPSTADVKFEPQGSLIAYKLGNKQKAGAYTFTPSGFTVNSNAFGDQGTFELNTNVPTPTAPTATLPSWTEGTPSALVYSFARGQEPGTIEYEASASKTYYAWVMPHKTQPTVVTTRVMLKGESSRPETDGFKDYTKTWFTDYTIKSTQLIAGRVHKLTANATHRVVLPIEYVTDYNLAGGEGLTYTSTNFTNPQPVGVTGELRFADSHSNDASGYYNWYKVMGRKDNTYNPQERDIQIEVDKTFGDNKYYVPTIEQWWGIYPSHASFSWTGSQSLNRNEYMAFGPSPNLLRASYWSDYSRGFSTDNDTQDAYVYAIRFKARPVTDAMAVSWDYDALTGQREAYVYPSASDNSLKCAYRFRRVGGSSAWDTSVSSNANLTNQLVIDVVYLGEEAVSTTLNDISNTNWWSIKQAEGFVISKVFPIAGFIYSSSFASGTLSYRGYWGYSWSSSQHDANTTSYVVVGNLYAHGNIAWTLNYGLPVRLFARQNP